jgi:NAD(P)H dehydrogenase (quinone)
MAKNWRFFSRNNVVILSNMKKIYILMGNPDTETLSGELADTYEREAHAAGHEVRRTNISDMVFDPILHKGYKVIQPCEPDLLTFQSDINWADHFVVIYPMWWSGMPALLKGLFDRSFVPGFAFKMKKREHWYSIPGWFKLLKGKTARVITLSRSEPWQTHLLFGNPTNGIARAILGFSGFSVRITEIGNSEQMSAAKKNAWVQYILACARKGK